MKNKRQEKLLELINDNAYYTQDELQEALTNLGYNVTQSTVSRDITQLRIVKALDANGNYRYVSNIHSSTSDIEADIHYKDIFKRSAIRIDCAFNDIVIKCHSESVSERLPFVAIQCHLKICRLIFLCPYCRK